MKSLALLALIVLVSAAMAAPPVAKKVPVTDTYHGVAVTDAYRWLEDAKNPEVQTWSEAQNVHARGILDKLPGVESLHNRIKEILTAKTTTHFALQHMLPVSRPPRPGCPP